MRVARCVADCGKDRGGRAIAIPTDSTLEFVSEARADPADLIGRVLGEVGGPPPRFALVRAAECLEAQADRLAENAEPGDH